MLYEVITNCVMSDILERRKTMKRIIAFVLSFAMLMGLSACGGKEVQKQEDTACSQQDITVTKIDKIFPSTDLFSYAGGAKVPEYRVLSGLENRNNFV